MFGLPSIAQSELCRDGSGITEKKNMKYLVGIASSA